MTISVPAASKTGVEPSRTARLPVTDKHKISRSKLAYIIDATAAPVCIIAPISSWAAAVSGTVEGVNGMIISGITPLDSRSFRAFALLSSMNKCCIDRRAVQLCASSHAAGKDVAALGAQQPVIRIKDGVRHMIR